MLNTSGGVPVRAAIATSVPELHPENRIVHLNVDLAGNLRVVIGTLTPATADPGSTTLLIVTNVIPVPVVANTNCSVITVQEDAAVSGWPTTPFWIRRPTSSSGPNQYIDGRAYAFTAAPGTQWQAGQTVGYIQLPASGSTTFLQDEQ